ncbi:MAG: twin-arginine translocation signal domain-containing protein [Desulfofustis sp. PB-SRB1]|jgi:hypothetical protein|nr:twin-arginine translocation signal domain-containing protein [Desulfofustis sp. PB-SRB1]HBH28460.1 hypothetical protein [Desulfofustis sp.]HBH31872.1 hypothetical protein [Desulfofustis sp.]
MGSGKKLAEYSRRLFLKTSTALLAGGVLGSVTANASEDLKQTIPAAQPLPWKWTSIDPMEAGTRAYHIYLEAGG